MAHKYKRSWVNVSSHGHQIEMPDGSEFKVYTTLLDNLSIVGSKEPAIALFPGFAEQGVVSKQALVYLASLGVPAVSSMLHLEQIPKVIQKKPEECMQAVEAIASQTPLAVGDYIKKINDSTNPLTAIGNSSGSGVLGLALGLDQESTSTEELMYGDVALMQPVGLAVKSGQDSISTAGLIAAFSTNAFIVSPPWRRGLHLATADVVRDVWRQRRTLVTQFDFAKDHSTEHIVMEQAHLGRTVVIAGEKDRVVPLASIRRNIGKHGGFDTNDTIEEDDMNLSRQSMDVINKGYPEEGLHLVVVNGARHESLAYPRGQKMLRIATQVLKLT